MPPNASDTNSCVKEQVINENVNSAVLSNETKIFNKNKSFDLEKKIVNHQVKRKTIAQIFGFKTELVWHNIVLLSLLHIMFVYYIFTFPYLSHKTTLLWAVSMGLIGGTGVTGGVHRYWTHRAYKAKLPLRILMFLCYYSTGQHTTVFRWCREFQRRHFSTEDMPRSGSSSDVVTQESVNKVKNLHTENQRITYR